MGYRRLLALVPAAVLAVAGVTTLPGAHAAEYPERSVRLIVPFSAGGGTDIVTRMFAQRLSDESGQTFVVENKAGGAAGSVGSREVMTAKPDGYTLVVNTASGLANAATDPAGFNPLNDLAPVGRLGSTTMVVMVNPDLPVKNIDELVAHIKANPGMGYGSSGVGSIIHYTTAAFVKSAGLDMVHVPYRGEQPALNDAIGGVAPVVFASVSASKPFIESGRLRALAVTSPERFPTLPDLPTLRELGYPDVVADVFYGMYITKGTPALIVERLSALLNDARTDEATSQRLLNQLNFNTAGTDTPEEFQQYMEKEYARFQELAAELNLVGNKDR